MVDSGGCLPRYESVPESEESASGLVRIGCPEPVKVWGEAVVGEDDSSSLMSFRRLRRKFRGSGGDGMRAITVVRVTAADRQKKPNTRL